MNNEKKCEVVITYRNEFSKETECVIMYCDTVKEAEQYIQEKEEIFAANPNIYAVYIRDKKTNKIIGGNLK